MPISSFTALIDIGILPNKANNPLIQVQYQNMYDIMVLRHHIVAGANTLPQP